MKPADTLQAASGRWPEILVAVGGISPDQLCSREGPCPHCSAGDPGSTRFRWDCDDGGGEWHCSHCGGKDGRGGGGNGLDLLSRLLGYGWGSGALKPTLAAVRDRFFGDSPPLSPNGLPRSAPRPRPPTGRQAFDLLDAAGQLAEDEGYVAQRGRGYQSRWLRWSTEANPDEVQAAILRSETEAGVWGVEEAVAEEEAATPGPGPAPGPVTLDGARATLSQALADGASRADLQQLVAQLGRDSELGGGAIGGILRALEQEQASIGAVTAEGDRLARAAGRRDGGEYLALGQLFPAGLAGSIARLTEYLPVDDPTSCLTFLATAAGTLKLGSEIIASRRLGWSAPLNLYAAMVGRSGIKKDPVYNVLMVRPLAPIAADLARAHQRAMADWKEENRGRKKSEQTDPPLPIFQSCSEFTGEALTQQLQQQETSGLGLLIKRSELAGLFGGLNAYRKGRGGDEEQLLEAYDGGGHSSLRVSAEGGGRFYQRCQLSIFGGIQLSVLLGLVGPGEDASGLWARFSFAPIPDRVVPLPADDSEEEAQITQQAAQHLADVAMALFRLPRVELTLTADAREMLFEYEARCQGDAQRSELDAMRAAWSKAPGKVLRVAGILHLIHRVCSDGEHGDQVAAAMVDRAMNLIDYLTTWALSLHESAAAGDATDLMRLVHSLAMASDGPVGWRRISQRLSVKQRREIDSAAALAAVEGLVALGVGVREEGARLGSWTYRAVRDLPQ